MKIETTNRAAVRASDFRPRIGILGNFSFNGTPLSDHAIATLAALLRGGADVRTTAPRRGMFAETILGEDPRDDWQPDILVLYAPVVTAAMARRAGYRDMLTQLRAVGAFSARARDVVVICDRKSGQARQLVQSMVIRMLRTRMRAKPRIYGLDINAARLAGNLLDRRIHTETDLACEDRAFDHIVRHKAGFRPRLTEAAVVRAISRLGGDDPLKPALLAESRKLRPLARKLAKMNAELLLSIGCNRIHPSTPKVIRTALGPSGSGPGMTRMTDHMSALGKPRSKWIGYSTRAPRTSHSDPQVAALARLISGHAPDIADPDLATMFDPVAPGLEATRLDWILLLALRPRITDTTDLQTPWSGPAMRRVIDERKVATGGCDADLPPSMGLICHSTPGSGLARNEEMSLRALSAAGLTPAVVGPADHGAATRPPVDPGLSAPVALWHMNADRIPEAMIQHRRWSGAYHIGFLLWELDRLPKAHQLALDLLDEIWVPTQFLADVYGKAFDGPVMTMRKGLSLPDPAAYPGPPPGVTRFLTCFDFHSSVERKNPLAAVQGFQSAFPLRSDVELIVKTTPMQPGHWGDPNGQMDRIADIARTDARIRIVEEQLPFAQLLGLIQSADCLISTHRAEGFGYLPAYALMLGTPVAATDYSGTKDFCDAASAWPLAWRRSQVPAGHAIHDTPGATWADVDVDSVAAALRDIADHPDEAARRTGFGRQRLMTEYSDASQAQRYHRRLGELGLLTTPLDVPAETPADAAPRLAS